MIQPLSLHDTQQKKAWRKSLRHAPIKENLIVKIEISYSSLVLRILRIKVGPAAHPVGAAIEGSDVGYGVETCPAGETCGIEQWAYGRKSVAFFGNLNLEKLALICWFCEKCIFLTCKTVIIVIFVWLLMDFILPLHLNTYFI